jgi:hypothetical protein
MKETARRARNEYLREYRRKNPEKTKAIAERYWMRKAAKMNAEAARKGGTDQPDREPSAQ